MNLSFTAAEVEDEPPEEILSRLYRDAHEAGLGKNRVQASLYSFTCGWARGRIEGLLGLDDLSSDVREDLSGLLDELVRMDAFIQVKQSNR